MKTILTLRHPETKKQFFVHYDGRGYDHHIYDDDGCLGKIRLRELFFAGYKCISKTITIEE